MQPKQLLTLREIEVLRSIAEGATYGKIAAQLGISAHTVAAHIKNIYRKLDVHTAGAAVMRAVELRLFGIEELIAPSTVRIP